MSDAFSNSFLVDLRLDRAAVEDFSQYPYCVTAVAALDELRFHPKATFLVGENGLGKSTLMEAIAVLLGLNPEGGTRNFNFETRASHSSLHEALELGKGIRAPRDAFFLRAESFFNLATEIERRGVDRYYGPKPLHEQSHGESFFALFLHRFGGEAVYLLDEPEAALSPMRQMAFLAAMHELIGKRSQFVIATHSPIIMAYPDAVIYEIGEKSIRQTAYEDTEHYRLTRGFLQSPQRVLAELLRAGD